MKSISTLTMAILITGCVGTATTINDENRDGEDPIQPVADITVDSLVGNWAERTCLNPQTNQSQRKLIIHEKISATELVYKTSVVTYPNNNCSGTPVMPQPAGITNLGIMRFDVLTKYNALEQFKGVWNLNNGRLQNVIWSQKSSSIYCFWFDDEPTSFPTLKSMYDEVAAASPTICYSKL